MHHLYSILGRVLFLVGIVWALYALSAGSPAPSGLESYAILGRFIAAAPGFGLAGFGLLMMQLADIGIDLAGIRRDNRRAADALEAIRKDQVGE